MISNKVLATLFLITVNMQRAVASSPKNPREPGPSDKPALVKKPGRTPKPKTTTPVLRDANNNMHPVEVLVGSTEEASTSQELSVPQANKEFEELIKQRKYNDVVRLAAKMNMKKGEFMKQLCLLVKTPEQYNGFVKYLKKCKMVASFYVHGDLEVVKKVIIAESRVYNIMSYHLSGDLEMALPLALSGDRHDRFIELLNVRKEIAAKEDGQPKPGRGKANFGFFVHMFFMHLAFPWSVRALRRLFVLRGDELRNKYPDILDTLCENLMDFLEIRCDEPDTERLLTDLIGQSSLLTTVSFTKGFLDGGLATDETLHNFIKYAWNEAIKEGLKDEYREGGSFLWQMIKKVYPDQSIGDYPPTADALTAVLKHFPTKQKLEEDWNKKCAAILYDKLKSIGFNFDHLPDALWSIIFGYAISWADFDDLTTIVK